MKLTLSWLKDFVDIDIPVAELGDLLTSLGLEVASINKRQIPQGIKVAKVLEVAEHPNANKLHICKVDAGESELLTIVCGAPNVAAGMMAPLATIGTKFSADFTISRAKLRGVESFGMLCSQKELGLSNDNSGLFALPQDMKIGDELSVYYPDDYLIEVELTPNRGDCQSVLGIAREIAAKVNKQMRNTSLVPQEFAGNPVPDFISVTVDAQQACPRYAGRLVRNVHIGPSPKWMAQRLVDAGVRPINNMVDITNYMMLHFGQPMHAFDFSRIAGKKIIVRKAGEITKFVTLDNIERKLVADDLLICDGSGPVALAGIMGGANSGISDSTTDVFIECAYFDPVQIRKTSKRLGLSTESSYRFERGVDADNALIWALDTAAELLRQCADSQIVPGRIDTQTQSVDKKVIIIRPSRVERLLGVPVTKTGICDILLRLQIACHNKGDDTIECTVPAFRHDIFCEADLIEEVGRFYGYDNIPAATYAKVSLDAMATTEESRMDTLRSSLAFCGLNEIMTNSLTSEKKNRIVRVNGHTVPLLNPLSPDMAQMRTSMLSAAFDVLAYNINRKNLDNRYFEIGRIYEAQAGSSQPRERDMLSIVLSGNFFPAAWNNTQGQKSDFYIVKGILGRLAIAMGAGSFIYAPIVDSSTCLENGAAVSLVNNVVTGIVGKIKSDICAAFDIKQPVYCAELDITDLLILPESQTIYKQLPKFPALERDFCFVLPEELTVKTIADTIFAQSPLVRSVEPFDVYRGDKLGAGIKSVAFSVRLLSPDKTLTDADAEEVCAKIIAVLETNFGATLRK